MHASGFPLPSFAGLIKDSRMGQSHPCSSLGMDVLEEHGSLPGAAWSASPQGFHVWSIQMIPPLFCPFYDPSVGHNLPPCLASWQHYHFPVKQGLLLLYSQADVWLLEENVQHMLYVCTCSCLLWEYTRMGSFTM